MTISNILNYPIQRPSSRITPYSQNSHPTRQYVMKNVILYSQVSTADAISDAASVTCEGDEFANRARTLHPCIEVSCSDAVSREIRTEWNVRGSALKVTGSEYFLGTLSASSGRLVTSSELLAKNGQDHSRLTYMRKAEFTIYLNKKLYISTWI